jgi:aminotransferase EvaB
LIVPFSYLGEQFSDSETIFTSLRSIVERGDFTLGQEVGEFEKLFADVCQAKFAVGVGSGTDALFLILKALGIGPGDEVITVPNTFIATVGAISAAGARPVFVDVNEQFLMDPARIEDAISPDTKAIVPVHLAGHPADMRRIGAIAESQGLSVVEDACQAAGAEIDGMRAGSIGVAAGFSLHPLKNLNVWGDGGVITTQSEDLDKKLRLLRNHGLKNRDEIETFGYNSRLDTLQAVVGTWLLPNLDRINEARIRVAARYDSGLQHVVKVPPRSKNIKSVFHLYFLIVTKRDELLAYLQSNGIEAKVHYPIPLHLQKASRALGYQRGDFPVCERQCRDAISLPMHQHLSDEQIDYVVHKIQEFYQVN